MFDIKWCNCRGIHIHNTLCSHYCATSSCYLKDLWSFVLSSLIWNKTNKSFNVVMMKIAELPSTAWALCSPCLLPNDVMWAVSLCDVCVSTLSLLIIAPHPARAQTPDTLIDTVYILCSLTLRYSDNINFCYHYTDTHIYSLHPAFCFSTLIIVWLSTTFVII